MDNNTKAIIFDFDYTLADSSESIIEGINYAFAKLGMPEANGNDIKETIGFSLKEAFIKLTNTQQPDKIEKFVNYYLEKAEIMKDNKIYIFDYVPNTVKTLKDNNLLIGIVSTKNRNRIALSLRNNKIDSFFDIVIGGEDVSEPKPDPEGLLKALEILKISPNECIYIGDSIVDAKTSQNANVKFIASLSGTTKKEAFYYYPHLAILNNVSELVNFLKINNHK
jgi:phosphoglycolate phosphatase